MTSSRLTAVLTAIDNINSEDPHQTIIDGHSQPNELLYGQYMSNCIEQYFPQSNELLKIAVRAQHIKRWDLKRNAFAEGKAGYYQWRIEQGRLHAQLTKSLMLDNGYDETEAESTACMLRKEKLKTNNDTQTLEDVACLVFLQYYFDAFAATYTEQDNEAKIIRIVKKTWGKMSDRGHEIALSLTLPDHLAALVGKALAE
jgi:hypothetical protein